MTSGSLRGRLMAGGAAAIAVALLVAGFGLTLLFERHLSRSLAQDLDVYIKQLLAGIEVEQGRLAVPAPPADPRFSEPLSGLYWQVSDDRGDLLRSRSLWDATLPLAADEVKPGDMHQHEVVGPQGARLLVVERGISLDVGDRRIPVRVAVAADLARVAAARSAFAADLAVALTVLGIVLALATAAQVVLGLRPLDALRQGIADIRSGRSEHLAESVPHEVRPLVNEVNALLDAQEKEIIRSRDRAADLAHGLKTPLAALLADARRLREKGEAAIAKEIDLLADAMTRHVDRELARARARTGDRRRHAPTLLRPLLGSLSSALTRAEERPVAFEFMVPDDLRVSIDRTDLAEALGNLLENAYRHAASLVRVTASSHEIVIEDDGPGIAREARESAMRRGGRLDEASKGAGLGLAIVQDVMEAAGWSLALDESPLGGLKAVLAEQPDRS